MTNCKIAFIGGGNMAQAILGGILSAKLTQPDNIIVSDISQSTLDAVKDKFSVATSTDNNEAVRSAEVVFLCIKPQFAESVLRDLNKSDTRGKLFISIIAGKDIAFFEKLLGKAAIIRTMPNTPALVGEGMTAMCSNKHVTVEEKELARALLSSFGKVEEVEERLINAVTGASGSSPAYVFMFIEAVADAAVEAGLPREQAYTFAAQAVLGSAKMVLETGKHPAELKDMVCSPGGTTIEAVRVLEEKGFRGSIIAAVKACVEKAEILSK